MIDYEDEDYRLACQVIGAVVLWLDSEGHAITRGSIERQLEAREWGSAMGRDVAKGILNKRKIG